MCALSCHAFCLQWCLPILMDSYLSGTLSPINSSFYKLHLLLMVHHRKYSCYDPFHLRGFSGRGLSIHGTESGRKVPVDPKGIPCKLHLVQFYSMRVTAHKSFHKNENLFLPQLTMSLQQAFSSLISVLLLG